MTIYHYDSITGCATIIGVADISPLDDAALLPAFSTPNQPPALSENQCARYLTSSGTVPGCHDDGEWVVHPDWRDARLWSTDDGREVAITEPNVTPAQIDATVVPYPGPGHVWRDERWQSDPDLQRHLTEQAAECELAHRQAVATAEINRIKPAVDGGYAKQEDVELLPKLQRYLYELPDVRSTTGWPESPQWPTVPTV